MNKTNSARGAVKPAAGKIGSAASTGWDSTLAAFAPLADAAKQGSARAAKLDSKKNNKKKNDKGGTKILSLTTTTTTETESTSHAGLYALLATGVVVGAAGALVARRRTRAKWAEYEPGSLHSDASSFIDAGATSAKSFGDKTSDTASDLMDGSGSTVSKATTWTKEHAKSAVDTIRTKIRPSGDSDLDEKVSGAVDKATDKASGMVDKAAEKVNEGANRVSDKAADAKRNATSHSGGSTTNTSGASSRTNRMDDEVDDLIRSAKNGRM